MFKLRSHGWTRIGFGLLSILEVIQNHSFIILENKLYVIYCSRMSKFLSNWTVILGVSCLYTFTLKLFELILHLLIFIITLLLYSIFKKMKI